MALAPVSKGVINTGTDANSYSFTAFTPTGYALLEVVAAVTGTNPLPTISDDGGLTWTLRQNNDTATLSIRMWTAPAPAVPTSTTITISFTGATSCSAQVVETPGGMFRQSATGSGVGGTTPAVTMASAILTTSAVVGTVINLSNPATLTPPTSYTEDQDIGHAAPAIGLESAFRASGETNTTVTWGSTSATNWRGELFEAGQGIAHDASTASAYQTAQSTYNITHTAAGDNRYAIVRVGMLSVAGSSVTSVTYGGVNMTFLGAQASVTGAVRIELWGLIAPATGAQTVTVNLSAALDSAAVVSTYNYVHQTSPTEGFASASATNGVSAADATVDVTSVANGCLIVDGVATTDTAITVGAGQTQRGNVTGTLGSAAGSDEGLKSPAGAVTMSWTAIAGLATWSIAAIALRPDTASALPFKGSLAMMGFGR